MKDLPIQMQKWQTRKSLHKNEIAWCRKECGYFKMTVTMDKDEQKLKKKLFFFTPRKCIFMPMNWGGREKTWIRSNAFCVIILFIFWVAKALDTFYFWSTFFHLFIGPSWINLYRLLHSLRLVYGIFTFNNNDYDVVLFNII